MIIILICSFKTQSTFVMLVYHCHYLACYCYLVPPFFWLLAITLKVFTIENDGMYCRNSSSKVNSIQFWLSSKMQSGLSFGFWPKEIGTVELRHMYNFEFSCRCVHILSCSSFFAFMRIVILIRSFKIWDHYSKGHS